MGGTSIPDSYTSRINPCIAQGLLVGWRSGLKIHGNSKNPFGITKGLQNVSFGIPLYFNWWDSDHITPAHQQEVGTEQYHKYCGRSALCRIIRERSHNNSKIIQVCFLKVVKAIATVLRDPVIS